jgi:hypothetical protein
MLETWLHCYFLYCIFASQRRLEKDCMGLECGGMDYDGWEREDRNVATD